ncbi:TPA: phage tail tape measure protein [Streptococcus suis]
MQSLGIKINIDYSDISKLKKEVSDKIAINVDTKSALSKISTLTNKLSGLKDDLDLELNVDVSKALSNLEKFEDSIRDLENRLKSLDLGDALTSGLDTNLTTKLKGIGDDIAKTINDSIGNATKDIDTKSIADDVARAVDSAQKQVKKTTSDTVDNVERSRLIKEIAQMKKEANALRIKRYDYDQGDEEYKLITSRLHSRNGMLGALVKEYNSLFKGDFNNDSTIKALQGKLDYSLAMKQAAVHREQQKQYDAETASNLKEYISLLNEQHSIAKKLANTNQDSQTASAYRDQIKYLDDVISKKEKLFNLDKRLNTDQKSSLKSLVADQKAELEYLEKVSQAKLFDNNSKENLKQLKDELKEIYNIREKMADLEAKEQSGVMSGKEESRLKNLQAELKILEEIHAQNRKNLEVTETQSRAVDEYENKRKASLDSRAAIAKERAELQRIDDAYDEIAASMKKVNSYYQMMENAGDNEAAALRQLISLEEQRQAEIRETNSLKERGNAIREEELADQKRLNQEYAEQADVIRRARNTDRFNQQVSAYRWADIINPREIYQEGKQAVLYMYNSVKEVEDQMVNIQKVLDPQDMKGFKTFREEIYDTASSVGKSASEYAVSVERWATAGKSLKEAQELGRISTIGAFVGNVDEAAMVDYMSVPLIAFKKHGVEATDIINSMNEVANNNAIEMDDLGAAYKRASGTASQVGTTFEELTGLITGAQETTRLGGERIGTSLKAFDVNLGKITARLTKQDQKKFDFFEKIGVGLTDAEGRVKSTYRVLEELQSKWNTLSTEDKNTAGFYIAGKQHQNILNSILASWDIVNKAKNEALGQRGYGEAGSAYQEFAVQQDSLQFKQAALKNSWDKFIYSVTGGKDVFAKAMDIMAKGLDKLSRLANNPLIRNIGKTLLSSLLAITTNAAISKGFELLSKGVQATINPLRGVSQALGGVQNISTSMAGGGALAKLAMGFSKVGSVLGIVTTTLQVADIGLRAFTGKGLVERVVDFSRAISKEMRTAGHEIRVLQEQYSNYVDKIGKVQEFRSAIQAHKELYKSVKALQDEQHFKFVETGDISNLTFAADEFIRIRDEHNALIDELKLPVDLKITFNNSEHILEQLRAVNDQMDKLEARANMDEVRASRELFGDGKRPRGPLQEAEANVNSKHSLYESQFQGALEQAWADYNANPNLYELKNNGIPENVWDVMQRKDELSQLPQSEKEHLIEAYRKAYDELKARDEDYEELVKGRKDSYDKLTSTYHKFMGNNDLESISALGKEAGFNVTEFFATTEALGRFQIDQKRIENGLGRLDKTYSKYQQSLENGTLDVETLAKEFNSSLKDLGALNKTEAVQEWVDKWGGTLDANWLLGEDNKEALDDLFTNVLPNASTQAKNTANEMKNVVQSLAKQFEISEAQAENLVNKYSENRAAWISEIMNIDQYAGADVLGITQPNMAIANIGAISANTDIGGFFADVYSDIESLQATLPEIPLKFGVSIDDNGNLDFNKILEDIAPILSLNDDILIGVGFKDADGGFNLNNFYSILNELTENEEIMQKVGIKFDENGRLDIEDFVSKLQNEEIKIQTTIDPQTGNLHTKVMEAVRDETGNIIEWKPILDTQIQNPDNPQKAIEAAIPKENTLNSKMYVVTEINPEYKVNTKNNSYTVKQYWDANLAQIKANLEGQPEEIVKQFNVVIGADGTIDVEKLDTAIAHAIQTGDEDAIELVKRVRAHFNLDESSPIDLALITQYLADTIGSGTPEEIEKEVQLMIDILTRVNKNSNPTEEIDGEMEEEVGAINNKTYTATPTANITLNANIEGKEEVNQQLMEYLDFDQYDTEVQLVLNAIVNGINEVENAEQQWSTVYALEDYIEKTFAIDAQYDEVSTAQEAFSALVNQVMETQGLQAVIQMLAEVFGEDAVQALKDKVDEVPDSTTTTVEATTTGDEELSQVVQDLNEVDGFKALADAAVNAESAVENLGKIQSAMQELSNVGDVSFTVTAKDEASKVLTEAESNLKTLDGSSATMDIKGDSTNYFAESQKTRADMSILDTHSTSPDIKADKSEFDAKRDQTKSDLSALDSSTGTPKINGDKSGWDTTVSDVRNSVASLNTTSATVMIYGDATSFWGTYNSISNLSTSIRVNISASVSKKSTSIGATIGRAMSSSIGRGLSTTIGKSTSSAINKMQSAATDATVNSDVWRHWSRDLYQGLPLENSLNNLTNAMKQARDDEAKKIDLYKQQIDLTKQQISLEQQNKTATQAQIAEVLSKLSGYGFVNSGNKVINLEHAKTLKGERASEAEKLLNDWRKLYESIDSIDRKISDSTQSVSDTNKDIEDERKQLELKEIEKSLKRTEALLTAVKNNTELQKVKLDMFDDSDFEIGIALRQEGINGAKSDIGKLIAEYNRLAMTYVQFEENAEKIESELENLKETILQNADAILVYRDEINQIQIDRLSNDYDKFTDSMERNLSMLEENTEALQDGLLSGEKLADRVTSKFGNLQFGTDTTFDKVQRDRIKLEDDLNKALDYYAKANIDRTANVAKQQLVIEASKYNEMLKMAQNFANGKTYAAALEFTESSLNRIESFSKSQNTAYKAWQDSLARLHNRYSSQYRDLVNSYDHLSNIYGGMTDKVKLNNEYVIKQLMLQEDMYRDIIKVNNTAIQQARLQLQNDTLRTDQKEELLKLITEYEDSSIDAESKIRDVVKDRYDFQFSLLDTEMDRIGRYSEQMEYLLSVAKLINASTSATRPIYEAIYGSKVNQFGKVKDEIAKLVREQARLEKGSLEWNLLEEKIIDVREALNDLAIEALNANKDILENEVHSIQESFEKGLFGGKTLDRWKEFRELWVQGITKELSLEDFRKRLLEIEDKTIAKRLEVLDLQDKVSQRDVDYIDKQLKVLELRQKLNNIEGERKVQELVRGDDGRWAFAYVADQTEYDKTKTELDNATKDLEKYREDQRVKYADDIKGILSRAEKGEFANTADLLDEINMVNAAYGMMAEDDPNLTLFSPGELVDKYKNYLLNNGMMVGNIVDETGVITSPYVDSIGAQFEQSFMNISADLGRVIGEEVRNALLNIQGGQLGGYVFNIESLDFPNVTDTTGFQEVLLGLPTVAKQRVLSKE